jgi:uncharacterized membrane protein
MLSTILLVVFYVFAPLLILYLCQRFPFLDKLGAVLIAYVIGLILGNSGLLPENSRAIQDVIASVCIPLAIPLLLFSSNVKQWSKLAGRTVLSMIIGMLGVIIMVIVGFFLFKSDTFPELWKVGGLLIGVYTGGTPNLASLKLMLDVQSETYLLVHTYDMVISGIYFLFLLTIAQYLFLFILPRYKPVSQTLDETVKADTSKEPFWGILLKKYRFSLLKGAGFSAIIFAVAGLLTLLFPKNYEMLTVILTITILGIGASFIPKINTLPKTFELGMYLILVFSLVVSSMVNIVEMLGSDPVIIYYITLVIFGSLVFHVVVSSFFRIDADTVMVTSTAMICSPPFVPAVAGAIRNKEIVVPGLTVGLIGYAIGNVLGVIVANFLNSF